jgi:hypothetical protein
MIKLCLILSIVFIFCACVKDPALNQDVPCECAPPSISGPEFRYQFQDSLGNIIPISQDIADSIHLELLILDNDSVVHRIPESIDVSGMNSDSLFIYIWNYEALNDYYHGSPVYYQFSTPLGNSMPISIEVNNGSSPEACCAYPFIEYLIDAYQDTIYQTNDYPYTGDLFVKLY